MLGLTGWQAHKKTLIKYHRVYVPHKLASNWTLATLLKLVKLEQSTCDGLHEKPIKEEP